MSDQVSSPKKMWIDCRTTHVLLVIWDVECNCVIFIFEPRKGQGYVKEDQITKLNIFFKKRAFLVQFCHRIPKRQIKKWQTCFFQQGKVISFAFVGHCAAKRKDNAWKF